MKNLWVFMRIYTVGGYNEVGKNMTLVEIGGDAFIFDIGLYMPPIVELEEDKRERINREILNNIGALPEINYIKNLANKVRAIIISHAHLDHVGAVPYLANYFNAPIICSAYTAEVLKDLINDLSEEEKKKFHNKIIKLYPNTSYIIRGKEEYKIELISITHSIPHSCIIALYTKEGNIVYTNDYKLDNSPVLGGKINYKALRRLSNEGIKLLITEALYADEERKTYSELIARDMLREVMLNLDSKGIIVTTFSSHIARLKSIVDFGKKLNREILFFGRSLNRYVKAAINVNLCPFKDDITLINFKGMMDRYFKKVEREREKYLVVCTGHQGEPGSVLDRLSRGEFKLRLSNQDAVIFSSKTIPHPINQANKELLERRLIKNKVRILTDVHVSGHAGREDMRDLIRLLNPEYILPSHAEFKRRSSYAELAREEGYKVGKDVLLLENGDSTTL